MPDEKPSSDRRWRTHPRLIESVSQALIEAVKETPGASLPLSSAPDLAHAAIRAVALSGFLATQEVDEHAADLHEILALWEQLSPAGRRAVRIAVRLTAMDEGKLPPGSSVFDPPGNSPHRSRRDS